MRRVDFEQQTIAAQKIVKPQGWLDARRTRVITCVSGISFMIMLDSNLVGVALPTIAKTLHATFAEIEWVVSGYILTFASLLMSAGALADRFGRRRLLMCGVSIFGIASVVCGVAPSASILNVSRALQGVGAAIQLSAALAVLGVEFRGADRARAFGIWGTVLGVAVTIGPLIGGTITSLFGWRWAFLVNTPICVLLIYLAQNAIIESRDPKAGRLDFAGIITFGSSLSLTVWALINANNDGWLAASTLIKFALSALLFATFIGVEKLQARPMVDLSLFKKRTYLGSSFAMIGFASAAQVMITYLPLYLQNYFGFGPMVAGAGMIPFALPLFICPRIAAAMSVRYSGRAILTTGLAIVAAGNFITAWCTANGASFLVVAMGMVITGCGAGILNGETVKVSMSVIPPERGGMASGIGGTVRFVGLVSSITGLGALLTAVTLQNFQRLAEASNITALKQINPLRAVSYITTGDIGSFLASFTPDQHATVLDMAKHSFAIGFSSVLTAAGWLGVVACALTYWLVTAEDTMAKDGSETSETESISSVE
jgi:EmrB/QacA subfamily drug resistance transporter